MEDMYANRMQAVTEMMLVLFVFRSITFLYSRRRYEKSQAPPFLREPFCLSMSWYSYCLGISVETR